MAIVASGSAPSYAIPAVVNIADLRLIAAGAFPVVMLQGTTAAGDGGGGFFYWSQSSVDADDSSLVVAPSSGASGRWLRLTTSHAATPVSTTGLIGQSLAILVGDYTTHPSTGSTLNEFGSVFEITGGAGTQSISRVALQAAAQSGGGGSNDFEAANFVAQQNAADALTSGMALQLNFSNNKADDALNPTAAQSHYGLAIVSGGLHKVGPGAIVISNSAPGTNDWQRGIQIATSSIASSGFAFDYGGPGTGGVFQVNANGSLGIGTTAIANAAVAIGQIGSILTGTSQYSVFESSVASSAATALFASFSAQPQTVAASFTCTTLEGFRANDGVKGAGSTITNMIGLDVQDLTVGTNNYGIRSAVSAGSNKKNLNITGTADNLLSGLLDISPSTAGQIKFPATQNAASDVNTLDDYEEGTWTPVLTAATPGDLSVSYTRQLGTYTKVGRLVTLTCAVTTSAFTWSTSSGSVEITGLPFTSLTSAGFGWEGALQWSGVTKVNYTNAIAQIGSNSALVVFPACGSAQAASNLAIADLPSGGAVTLRFTISYETT